MEASLLVVPLVLALVQGIRQVPWIRDESQRWLLPWIAVAFGIAVTFAWAGGVSWSQLLPGIVNGLAAAGLYDSTVNAVKKKIASLADAGVGNGLLVLVTCALGLALATSGCTAQATYRMEAVAAVSDSLAQIETAIDESAASVHGRIDLEGANSWTAYQEDLKTVLTKPLGEQAAELARLALKYRGQMNILAASRSTVDTRFSRAAEHVRFCRETLADVYALEQGNLSIQQRLERYRVLATEYARQRFGLTTPTMLPATAPQIGPPAP